MGASLPVNLILNWDEVGKDNVISRDDLSASQPVPGEKRWECQMEKTQEPGFQPLREQVSLTMTAKLHSQRHH